MEICGEVCTLRVLPNLDRQYLEKFQAWKKDEQLTREMLVPAKELSLDEVNEWYQQNATDPNQIFFCMFDNEDNELIGGTRLREIDRVSATAEFGIYIGEKHRRGRGIGREAMHLTLNHGFQALELHKITLRVSGGHRPALMMYQAAGFVEEGYQKEQFFDGTFRHDVVLMGLLARNYAL